MQKTKGISLIVLVITIIVMIILAGAIVLTLSNSGIIRKAQHAVDITNEENVNAYAQTVWAEAYLNTNRTQEKLEKYVLDALEKAKVNIDEYAIKVTTKGVSVVKSVVDTVDGVPIPKGFVASQVEGENTKDGGLVIYEGATPVTKANVELAKRERNQYVWVPVDDFNDFKRQNFDGTTEISNTLGIGYWEVELDETTNMPLPTQDANYMTSTTLEEVQAMYASVQKYKGFYVARYEAGLDVGKHKTINDGEIITNIHSKMNKAPYNYVRWTYNDKINEDTNGKVEIARSVYSDMNSNYGAVSTLIYGVQWDRTLTWWLEVGAKTGTGETVTSISNSGTYGNYKYNEIPLDTFNEGAKYTTDYINYDSITATKPSYTTWLFTTGATEEARVNNIYDMAGNLWERTMEGIDQNKRASRAGCHTDNGWVGARTYTYPNGAYELAGFRIALYIK